MDRWRTGLLAALLCILPGAGLAQQQKEACYDRVEGEIPANTYYNAQTTDSWRRLLQVADSELMGQVAGVYFSERPSPDGQYINRQYRQLTPDGLFQYEDETCGTVQGVACSQNQGSGEWRATPQADGTIYMMIHFSDLIRTSACAGGRYQMNGANLVEETGFVWLKVP